MKFICIALMCALMASTAYGAVLPKELKNIAKNLTIISSMKDFRAKNPELKLIPLTKSDNARATIVYTLGQRYRGDQLVAQGSNGFTYPVLSDVSYEVVYPERGEGAVVTYVEVVVQQSSQLGNAYVVDGGVGQRFIHLLIEAFQTNHFSTDTYIFGLY